jgi:hypothetical protein
LDEDKIEEVIDECLTTLEEHPERFTKFEIDFLESVEDKNETGHLTEVAVGRGVSQLDKLLEIHQERVTEWNTK